MLPVQCFKLSISTKVLISSTFVARQVLFTKYFWSKFNEQLLEYVALEGN